MADRRTRRFGGATLAALVALLVASLLAPAVALAAPRPGESCADATAAPGESLPVCGEGNGPDVDPGSSIDTSLLLPILAAGGVGAGLALVIAFLFFRRRAAVPAGEADPGEWWTCRNCGRNNVIGSPRCYACGEWQG